MPVAIAPVTAYALVLVTVVVICVIANILHRPPMRDCPQCGERVRQDARRCRHCRYQFV